MTKIIGIFGVESNVGRSTIGHTLAQTLAQNSNRVLYLEFDYFSPSFSQKVVQTNSTKNMKMFMENMILHQRVDIENYILTKGEMQKGIQISELLDCVVFPNNYQLKDTIKETLTEEQAYQIVNRLMNKLKNLQYDVVVINLPKQVDNIFGLPIMQLCDHIINILNPNITSVSKYLEISNLFKKANIENNLWLHVFNMCSPRISEDVYQKLLDAQMPICIPYDPERADYEFQMQIGSPVIEEKSKVIARKLGFFIRKEESRPGFFNKLVRP